MTDTRTPDAPISLAERKATEKVAKIVGLLEEALKMARSGDVEDACIILLKRGGYYENLANGVDSPLKMIGHLESMKWDILKTLTDDA